MNTASIRKGKVVYWIVGILYKDRMIKDIVSKISDTVDKMDTKLLSVPGINIIACAIILGETNNFENFSSSKKLLAFAGLDPKIRQSGNFYASSCRMSKKDSPYLRRFSFYCMEHCQTLRKV